MKIKKIVAAVIAASMCMAAAGCSEQTSSETSDTTAAQTTAETKSETKSETTEADVITESDASENTELSGKVTVYMPSPAGLADKIAEGFKKSTGVEVEVFQGTTGEILARLEAEEANPVADVVILASWSDGLSMKNGGKIMSLPKNVFRLSSLRQFCFS